MKIRILGNSVRYRLTKSEVATLGAQGFTEDHTDFAGNRLTYAVQCYPQQQLAVDYNNNRITLFIPEAMAAELAGSDKVGFSGQTGPVKILIEKDFACIDNTMEDQSDNYPNPNAVC